MGKITDYPAMQQSRPQESVSRTFYVLRETGLRYGFTKVGVRVDGRPEFDSDVYNTVDDVTQFSTLESAVSALSKAKASQFCGLRYEIVMVSRSVTKGVLKSPAKTVRRVLQKGDLIPLADVKYALANPYSTRIPRDGDLTSWFVAEGGVGVSNFETTPLFTTLDELVVFAAQHPQVIASSGAKVCRVVEETVPEVRTEDVVKDILTPLP